MVGDRGRAYVQRMPTTTSPTLLRLDHAELCTECRDLLQAGTPVVRGTSGSVSCLACADDSVPSLRLVRTDAWSVLDDPELRSRLLQRRAAPARRYALSA
jgi:hypothetical protein